VGNRNSEAASVLRRQLGADLAVLDQLTEAECAELLQMISEVRAAQREALNKSLGKLIDKLPRLVRVPARKIMFG
jgi:hypothetical protein